MLAYIIGTILLFIMHFVAIQHPYIGLGFYIIWVSLGFYDVLNSEKRKENDN